MAIRRRERGDHTGRRIEGFPYPYNTDLHWLWGWGQRVQSWYDDDRLHASDLDGLIYNPCRHATDAMMRFSIDYDAVINEIRKAHREVENRCEEAIASPSENYQSAYASSLEFLYSRIFKACELIAEREPPEFHGDEELPAQEVSELPSVSVEGQRATIQFNGKTYEDVDYEASVLLSELCESHPIPKGLTNDDRPQPGRLIKKLPKEIQDIIETSPKGRVIKL